MLHHCRGQENVPKLSMRKATARSFATMTLIVLRRRNAVPTAVDVGVKSVRDDISSNRLAACLKTVFSQCVGVRASES